MKTLQLQMGKGQSHDAALHLITECRLLMPPIANDNHYHLRLQCLKIKSMLFF
ncbi:hypothetical protein [Janthinobacterium violaceinigrum]|uniref:hypothetical protein n=1 Tax=Janthinobacterium violaceinigrum TaxID=2654252 RepID=UPI00186AFF75|nr:hypothetical protein [Janthinobacterium violaceinigrum]